MESRKFDDQGLTRAQRFVRAQSSSLGIDLIGIDEPASPTVPKSNSGHSGKNTRISSAGIYSTEGVGSPPEDEEDPCYESAYKKIINKLSGEKFTRAMDAVAEIEKVKNTGPLAEAAWEKLREIDAAIFDELKECLKT
jgi:hypothetical protein